MEHTLQWSLFDDHPCQLGESPVWDDRRMGLWWIDGRQGLVFFRLGAQGHRHQREFGERIGSIGLTATGRMLIAFSQRVEIWDPDADTLSLLSEPALGTGEALNDGKNGPDGAFWVGSKGTENGQPAGRLFRIRADGSAEPILNGLATSNGIAWTLDSGTFYLSDSKGQWIDAFAFTSSAPFLSRRRRMHTTTEEFGRPDGAATDVKGVYWSCGVSAGRINRFSRDGRWVDHVGVPVAAPTMVCFGGADHRTLYLTSLRRDGAGSHCGKVFCAESGVAGVPIVRFLDHAM